MEKRSFTELTRGDSHGEKISRIWLAVLMLALGLAVLACNFGADQGVEGEPAEVPQGGLRRVQVSQPRVQLQPLRGMRYRCRQSCLVSPAGEMLLD